MNGNKNVSQLTMTNLSQLTMTNLSQFTMTNLSQFTMTNLSQLTMTNLSQLTMTNLSQLAMTNLSQLTMTNLSQLTMSNLSQLTMTNLSQLTMTNLSQLTMTNLSQLTINVRKCPPSTSVNFATRVRKIACCSSQLIFAFLYAGSSIQNASEHFVCIIYISFANSLFNQLHKQKSKGVTSGYPDSSISETIQSDTCSYKLFFTQRPITINPKIINLSYGITLYNTG